MSTERQRQQAAARERKKKSRAAAAAERAERVDREKAAGPRPQSQGGPAVSVAQARRWPIRDAWISERWDDIDAIVHGGISRADGEGRFSAAFFTVDPSQGLTDMVVLLGLPEGAVNQQVVARASESAMVFCEAPDVAALLKRGRTLSRERSQALPDDFSATAELLSDVDPDEATREPSPPKAPRPPSEGLLERARKWWSGS